MTLLTRRRYCGIACIGQDRDFRSTLLSIVVHLTSKSSTRILINTFSRLPPSKRHVVRHVKLFHRVGKKRKTIFTRLATVPAPRDITRVVRLSFLTTSLSRRRYVRGCTSSTSSILVCGNCGRCNLCPAISSHYFTRTIGLVNGKTGRIIVCGRCLRKAPAIVIIGYV